MAHLESQRVGLADGDQVELGINFEVQSMMAPRIENTAPKKKIAAPNR